MTAGTRAPSSSGRESTASTCESTVALLQRPFLLSTFLVSRRAALCGCVSNAAQSTHAVMETRAPLLRAEVKPLILWFAGCAPVQQPPTIYCENQWHGGPLHPVNKGRSHDANARHTGLDLCSTSRGWLPLLVADSSWPGLGCCRPRSTSRHTGTM